MSKKIKQIESKTHTEQYNTFVSPLIHTGDNDRTDADYTQACRAQSTEQSLQNRRQADSDLWDMLSFRGMTFADAISDLNKALYDYQCEGHQNPMPVNVLERFGMCVIRATFKDLIAKGADEYQTAVYDDFRHDLRIEMSRRMAEETAYEVNRNRKGDTVRGVDNEQAVRVLKNNSERFGAGMDLMHAIIAQVLDMAENDFIENMSEEVSVLKNRKSVLTWKGEDELSDEAILKKYNAVDLCFKACRDEIERQASIKAVDNGYTYIDLKTRTRMHGQSEYINAVCADDRDGYEDEKLYVRMNTNIFTGECTSISQVKAVRRMIAGMRLTEAQMRRLEMKARGYSIEQIAGEEGTSRRAIQKSIEQVRQKALTWLQAQEMTAGAETASEMFMNIERYEAQAEAQAQTEAQAQAEAQAWQTGTQTGAFTYWKNKKLIAEMQAGTQTDAYDFNYWKQETKSAEDRQAHEDKALMYDGLFYESEINRDMTIVKTPWSEKVETRLSRNRK